jgi:hypothetical protein
MGEVKSELREKLEGAFCLRLQDASWVDMQTALGDVESGG